MRVTDSFLIAWRGLKHAGMRSFLTMLGIIIGISSVILLMSIGRSSQNYILSQVKGIGSNLVMVAPSAPMKGSKIVMPSAMFGVVIKTLKDEDIEALKREPSVLAVATENHGQGRAIYGSKDVPVTYTGVNGEYSKAIDLPTIQGVWFDDDDIDAMNHVAVIGQGLAEDLFDEANPIGKSFRIKNISFQVIGLLDKKGAMFGANIDSMAFLPSSVVHKQLLGIDHYGGLVVSARDEYSIEFVKQRVASVLRANHHITDPDKDDFLINTQEEVLSILGNITSILAIFLTSIACISLVVGGIGIMNIMLVSVVERTKEIGLRKAVGASNNDILTQFLWEAVMLTFVGGAIGIAVGAIFTALAYFVIHAVSDIEWTFALPASAIMIAVITSTIIGLVFGIYPARKAALKNPIEALHYE